VRPCPADQYFRPRGASACAFSLSTAGRFSSSVPEPGIESRHLCTGHHMASKQISAMLVPRAEGTLRFRCRLLIRFDAFSVVHLRSSLYSSHDVIYSRLLTMTFTTAAFDRSSSWLFEACFCKPASKGLPSSPAQHHAPKSAFLTQPLLGPGRAHPVLIADEWRQSVHPERDEACSVEEANVKPVGGYVSMRIGVAGSGGVENATIAQGPDLGTPPGSRGFLGPRSN
jgi:hypothetical protein